MWDRIEKLRSLAESSTSAKSDMGRVLRLIADELEEQRLRMDGIEHDAEAHGR